MASVRNVSGASGEIFIRSASGSSVRRSVTMPSVHARCQDHTVASTTRRVVKWIGELANTFFSPISDSSDDPLVDIVRRDPIAASRFIRTIMIFSGLGSVVVCICCLLFLLIFWSQCQNCDRPLRWWLLMHSFLQGMQVPVRFVFLAKMSHVDAVGGSIEACISSFTASPAWQSSKNVSLFTYGWFVLGTVWVMNAGGCIACPGVYRMTIAVILQAIARAIVALVCFRILFPQTAAVYETEMPKIEGADPHQISSLPLVCFTRCLFSEDGANCAVCLCEYDLDESLRRLPCGHHFHRRCADKWLKRSKRCPLCMRAIDAVDGVSAGGRQKL